MKRQACLLESSVKNKRLHEKVVTLLTKRPFFLARPGSAPALDVMVEEVDGIELGLETDEALRV